MQIGRTRRMIAARRAMRLCGSDTGHVSPPLGQRANARMRLPCVSKERRSVQFPRFPALPWRHCDSEADSRCCATSSRLPIRSADGPNTVESQDSAAKCMRAGLRFPQSNRDGLPAKCASTIPTFRACEQLSEELYRWIKSKIGHR